MRVVRIQRPGTHQVFAAACRSARGHEIRSSCGATRFRGIVALALSVKARPDVAAHARPSTMAVVPTSTGRWCSRRQSAIRGIARSRAAIDELPGHTPQGSDARSAELALSPTVDDKARTTARRQPALKRVTERPPGDLPRAPAAAGASGSSQSIASSTGFVSERSLISIRIGETYIVGSDSVRLRTASIGHKAAQPPAASRQSPVASRQSPVASRQSRAAPPAWIARC
jgi:hypothetical protein